MPFRECPKPGTARRRSYEELLKKAVRNVGPFVAVGRPADKLPQFGAARLYVEDADWQESVAKLLRRARLVFDKLGTSEGLLWDMRQILAILRPEQMILCLPFGRWENHMDPEAYERFRRESRPIFPRPLPETLEGGAQFIYFASDWQLRVLVPGSSATGFTVAAGESMWRPRMQPYVSSDFAEAMLAAKQKRKGRFED